MCPPDDVAATVPDATTIPATPEPASSIPAAEVTISPEAAPTVTAAGEVVPEVPPHYSIIETWVNDLIGNIPHLRETEVFNIFRNAIEDLKSKL